MLVCCAGAAAAQSVTAHTTTPHLYWSNGAIFEARLNGTHGKTIAKRGHNPQGVAVGRHLYWATIGTSGGSFYSGKGMVFEANLNGTHTRRIAKLTYNWDTSHGLAIQVAVAVGGGHLYWASGSEIVEANLNGTHAKAIDSGQSDPLGLAVGDGHLYWGLAGYYNVSSSGGGDWQGGTIVEANLNGTDAKTIASVGGFPYSIGVGGDHVYWANGNSLVEANLDGTDAKTILGSGSGFSGVLAVGHGHLYWAGGQTSSHGAEKIVEANLDGTHAKTITRQGAAGIAVGS